MEFVGNTRNAVRWKSSNRPSTRTVGEKISEARVLNLWTTAAVSVRQTAGAKSSHSTFGTAKENETIIAF